MSKFTINSVFKDPSILYSLDLFDKDYFEYIDIFEKRGKPYLKCFVSNIDRPAKPEEIVRQLFLLKLTKEYCYPKERIAVEKSVTFGSSTTKRADIVVFHSNTETPYIIVETKKPKRKDGVKQLKSYCNAEGSPLAVWTNGKDIAILHREPPNNFINIPDIPAIDQTIADILNEEWTFEKLTKENKLAKGLSLRELIQNLENLVLANSGVDAFEEVFKLIYAKLFDEFSAKTKSKRKGKILFRKMYGEPDEDLYHKISLLFEDAKKQWKGIFSDEDRIKLRPSHLATCVSFLQQIKLFNSNLFVIDEAFEYLVTEVAKGKKGQYFTPRHVIDMCIKMLNPKKSEYVIDTACGSCGFTVHTLFHAFNYEGVFSAMDPTSEQRDYASNMIYGIDFDEKAVKIAKALNLIAGDGKSNVYKSNTLDSPQWEDETKVGLKKMLKKFDDYEDNKNNEKKFTYFDFDVLTTNPPFAGEISEEHILKNYNLAKRKNKTIPKIDRHILFIERNLNFLKDGGRMAIVLPQGIFNNTTTEYIRKYLSKKARILAIVSLHENTFKPHTSTKTSVLFLQKWHDKKCPKKEDYPIFFAISKESGKDNSGNYIFERRGDNSVKIDTHGHPIIKHDLFDISKDFVKFSVNQNMSFH